MKDPRLLFAAAVLAGWAGLGASEEPAVYDTAPRRMDASGRLERAAVAPARARRALKPGRGAAAPAPEAAGEARHGPLPSGSIHREFSGGYASAPAKASTTGPAAGNIEAQAAAKGGFDTLGAGDAWGAPATAASKSARGDADAPPASGPNSAPVVNFYGAPRQGPSRGGDATRQSNGEPFADHNGDDRGSGAGKAGWWNLDGRLSPSDGGAAPEALVKAGER